MLGGFAAAGLAIALYLSANALAGTAAACLPGGGCETVAQSEYSRWLGIPVALFGILFSGVLLGLIAAWWRTGDGRRGANRRRGPRRCRWRTRRRR